MVTFEQLREQEQNRPAEQTHEQYWQGALDRAQETRDGPLPDHVRNFYREYIETARALDKQEQGETAALAPTERPQVVMPSAETAPAVGDFSAAALDAKQRWAQLFITAGVIPEEWSKKGARVAVARVVTCLELSQQIGINPLILVQNVDFIAGRLYWKSTFVLQLLRKAGWRCYEFRFTGDPRAADFWEDDRNGCQFFAKNPETGNQEAGTYISVAMVKREKWRDRLGSKWQSMPEQMFKYRSVKFFCNTNAPEVLLGYRPADEAEDIIAAAKEG